MDNFNPYIHHRRSIRLGEYDYTIEGLYFITICLQNYKCLFGNILDDIITLNDAGKMIETEWLSLPNRYSLIQLHEFIIMPNHFHAIIQIAKPSKDGINETVVSSSIVENVGAALSGNEKNTGAALVAAHRNENKTISDIVGAFKSITTVKYIQGVKTLSWPHFEDRLWQHNYWEHIIRRQESYQQIADYIITNPAKWKVDKLNR
jgi:REP element-mobilizing transposase RayT